MEDPYSPPTDEVCIVLIVIYEYKLKVLSFNKN
jgi:hypothetical protein